MQSISVLISGFSLLFFDFTNSIRYDLTENYVCLITNVIFVSISCSALSLDRYLMFQVCLQLSPLNLQLISKDHNLKGKLGICGYRISCHSRLSRLEKLPVCCDVRPESTSMQSIQPFRPMTSCGGAVLPGNSSYREEFCSELKGAE